MRSVPCSVEGCNKQIVARGWCGTHYTRWKRHRDPLFLGREQHGFTRRDKLYRLWAMMKHRVKPGYSRAQDYYERGIRMYGPWEDSFTRFYADVMAGIGAKPGEDYSIDRIDNDGDYEPGNIRWATRSQQQLNKRPPKPWVGNRLRDSKGKFL